MPVKMLIFQYATNLMKNFYYYKMISTDMEAC